jgi:transcriptional regulator with XRE-family HTH domain
MLSMESFSSWLLRELKVRDMSQSDLARIAGLGSGTISNIVSGNRKVGQETLAKIARALRVPDETVFRAAGLLPPVSEIDELKAQMLDLTADMSREEQREVLEYLRMKRRLREEREQEQQSLPLGEKSLNPRRAGSE